MIFLYLRENAWVKYKTNHFVEDRFHSLSLHHVRTDKFRREFYEGIVV